MADYRELVHELRGFDGTSQAGSKLPIMYSEYGHQTKIPLSKIHLYTGREQPSVQAVSEALQSRYLTQALGLTACQPNVVALAFFLNKDEKDLEKGWQSGFHYADGSRKTTFTLVRPDIIRFKTGLITC
jgi:hypothetical protein